MDKNSKKSDKSDLKSKLKQKQMQKKKKEMVDQQIKQILGKMLEDSAFERMMTVKAAGKSQIFQTAIKQIMALYKRKGRKLSESEVRNILSRISSEINKDETNIEFKRK